MRGRSSPRLRPARSRAVDLNPPPLRIETLHGSAILPHLDSLASLRIAVFRDWPYLYDGDAAYERGYVATYAASPRAAIVVVRDGDAIVGASTCLPLDDETDDLKAPFRDAGIDPASVFYFGESVLLKAWRRHGIGVAFFAAREAHAKSVSDATHAAFCAVIRDPADPRRPPDAVPLDGFWRKRGFSPRPGLACRMHWREIGHEHETENTLQVWMKPLRPEAA